MKTSNRKRKFQKFDWFIFIPYIILCVIGVIMVYSASSYVLMASGNSMWRTGFMQALFFIVSLIMIWVIYITKTDFWKKSEIVTWVFLIAIALLLFVLLFGRRVNGAKGWIDLGVAKFQPMELFKLMLIVMMARLFSNKDMDFKHRFITVGGTLLGLALIMGQPDTGGFLICSLILLCMWACAGQSAKVTFWIGTVIILGFVGIFVIFPHIPIIPEYMKSRFLVASNPFDYAREAGHQLVNSYYALSNGGWFGLGLGNSIEKKGFLPEAQTDFIFSIIVEELGMIVGLLIIGLLLFLIGRILYIGIKAKEPFHAYLCIGVASMLFIQMFINLGGLVGLIPLTGVTLPFLSQGGSSLLFFSIGVALAMNVSASEYEDRLPKSQIRVVK